MKRVFDLILGLVCLIFLSVPMIFISIGMKLTSNGPIIYWSKRVGKNGEIFEMPKFRSMKENTPIVATHLLESPDQYLFPLGSFIRRYSIDEFPQLFSIIKGDMSFVGPRPALFNQNDLISLREAKGIHQLVPGVTGLAQISGRDNLTIEEKVLLDFTYLNNRSFLLDLKIICKTFLNITKKDGVSH